MTLQLKTTGVTLETTTTTVYTCPAGTTATVTLLNVSNRGTASGTYTLNIVRGATTLNLATNFAVPISTSQSVLAEPGKLTLEAGDVLSGTANVANRLDVVISVAEKS